MTASIPSSASSDLIVAARSVPLVQRAVGEFADKWTADELASALTSALPVGGVHAATVIAAAAARRGAPLDLEAVRRLLPELDSIELFGPLVFAAGGNPVDLLVCFLEDGAGAWEREALAVLLAADALGGAPAPPRLIAKARRLARRQLGLVAASVLGAGAARLGDPHLDALAVPYLRWRALKHGAPRTTSSRGHAELHSTPFRHPLRLASRPATPSATRPPPSDATTRVRAGAARSTRSAAPTRSPRPFASSPRPLIRGCSRRTRSTTCARRPSSSWIREASLGSRASRRSESS